MFPFRLQSQLVLLLLLVPPIYTSPHFLTATAILWILSINPGISILPLVSQHALQARPPPPPTFLESTQKRCRQRGGDEERRGGAGRRARWRMIVEEERARAAAASVRSSRTSPPRATAPPSSSRGATRAICVHRGRPGAPSCCACAQKTEGCFRATLFPSRCPTSRSSASIA